MDGTEGHQDKTEVLQMEDWRCWEKLPGQAVRVSAVAEELFRSMLDGVFLFGSATLGGLRPESDLDLLILIRDRMPPELRNSLTAHLLALSGRVGERGKRPLEVTVVDRNAIQPWRFPPECEYQYGEWLRRNIEAGNVPQRCRMPDLAVLLWQARVHSVPLIPGVTAADRIPFLAFGEICKAIRHTLPGLLSWLKGDERNVILTLCRMWFTLETGTVCPKDAAADWVLPRIPAESAFLVRMARSAYLGQCRDDWSIPEKETFSLADFLSRMIERELDRKAFS